MSIILNVLLYIWGRGHTSTNPYIYLSGHGLHFFLLSNVIIIVILYIIKAAANTYSEKNISNETTRRVIYKNIIYISNCVTNMSKMLFLYNIYSFNETNLKLIELYFIIFFYYYKLLQFVNIESSKMILNNILFN